MLKSPINVEAESSIWRHRIFKSPVSTWSSACVQKERTLKNVNF